jgi:ATP synthase protein I
MTEKKPSDKESFLIAFGIYGGIGFQLAAAVVVGAYLGYLGDEHWGTEPWLVMLGVILGSIGGFVSLLRALKWNDQRKEK